MTDKKQKKNKVDTDMDFGDLEDLNAEDMDFGELEDIDDDRNPSKVGIAKEMAEEAGKGFFDGLAKQTAKKALPEEYTSNFYELMDYADFTRETFERNKNKVEKSVYRLGKEAKKLLPFQFKLLDRFLEKHEAESEQARQASEDEQRDASIQSHLSGIFDKQLEIQKALEAKRDADDAVEKKERISIGKLHMDVLTSIDSNTANQSAFTLQISKEYYRRSLELQFKSYYVQADMLRTMREYYKGFTLQFDSIVKNTGLPEFVKLNNTERISEILRNQAIQSTYKRVFDNNKYIETVKGRVGQLIDEKVTGVTDKIDAVTDVLGGINSATEMGGSATGITGSILSGMLGTTLGEKLANKISPKIKDWIKDNRYINAGANYLGALSNSPSTLFATLRGKAARKQEAYADESSPSRFMASRLFGGLNEVLGATEPGKLDAQVRGQSLLNHNKPAIFDNKVHRSITEVIPMYLAKILKENTDLRSMYQTIYSTRLKGHSGAQELTYDYEGRELVTGQSLRERVEKSILTSQASKGRMDAVGSLMVSSALTQLNKDKKGNKEQIRLLTADKSKKLLSDYLAHAGKDDNLSFDYKTLVEDAVDPDKRPLSLRAFFQENPQLEKILTTLKEHKDDARNRLVSDRMADVKRVYPIEAVKNLFSGASKIAGGKIRTVLKDADAEIVAKAFTQFLTVAGKDITLDNLATAQAFQYLPENALERLRAPLTLLVSDAKSVKASEDFLKESSFTALLAAVNRSLRDNIELDPEVFQTLYEYSPLLGKKGVLTTENLVERKLTQTTDTTYASLDDLRSLSRATRTEVNTTRLANLQDSLGAQFTQSVNGFIGDIRGAGSNPFALGRAVIKHAKSAVDAARQVSVKRYNDTLAGLEGLGTSLGTLTEDTIAKSLSTLVGKLEAAEQSLAKTIQSERAAKDDELRALQETKRKLTETLNDPTALRDIEKTIATTTRWYDINLKTLEDLEQTLKTQREALRRLQAEGITDAKRLLTRAREEVASTLEQLKALSKRAQAQESTATL